MTIPVTKEHIEAVREFNKRHGSYGLVTICDLALEALQLRALVPSDDVLARIDYRTDAETDEWLDRVRAYREGR
jgi:hypothetical protein